MSDETPSSQPTAAETVGRTAGLLAKLVVRKALKSKTVREQLHDAQVESNRPADPAGDSEGLNRA